MTTSGKNPQDDRDVGPLGSDVSPPSGNDDADGMAGPVYPPPETEPDAHEDSTRRGLGRLLHRDESD
jgi:hypothetical protein